MMKCMNLIGVVFDNFQGRWILRCCFCNFSVHYQHILSLYSSHNVNYVKYYRGKKAHRDEPDKFPIQNERNNKYRGSLEPIVAGYGFLWV